MSGENSPDQRNGSELSRRKLLAGATGSAMAAAAGMAGCTQSSAEPKKLGMLNERAKTSTASAIDHPPGNHEDQPAISFEEGTAAVEQFKNAVVPNLGSDETRIHGVLFSTKGGDGGKAFFEVLWKGSKNQKPDLPDCFQYQPPVGSPKTIAVVPREIDHARPHVRIGEPASYPGAPTNTFGTAGWHILFNNRVCCVSARHVIANPMLNPTNSRVTFFASNAWSALASRFYVEPIVAPPAMNLWDIGMAAYDNPTLDAARIFINCQSGDKPYGYPMSICTSFATNDAFHKVGAGTPPCGTGVLRQYLNGYGTIAVWYGTQRINYQNQLCLDSTMAGNGDSGAIVASDGNWQALGVHQAGDSLYCYASPLFNLGLNYQGVYTIPNTTRQIPSYTKP